MKSGRLRRSSFQKKQLCNGHKFFKKNKYDGKFALGITAGESATLKKNIARIANAVLVTIW